MPTPAPILISSKPGVESPPTEPASTNGTTCRAPSNMPVLMRASNDSSVSERPPVGSPAEFFGPIAW